MFAAFSLYVFGPTRRPRFQILFVSIKGVPQSRHRWASTIAGAGILYRLGEHRLILPFFGPHPSLAMLLGRRIPLYTYRCLPTISHNSRRSLFKYVLEKEKERLQAVQKYTLLKTVNALPTQVYDVVSEIDWYKEFIPYCVDSFIDKRDSKTGQPTEAGLRIGFKKYDEKFSCDVVCLSQPDKQYYTVEASSISHNLFQTLSTKWSIIPHPRKPHVSQVELVLKFQFHSLLYNSVSSIFADNVTKLAMGAFAQRAEELAALRELN